MVHFQIPNMKCLFIIVPVWMFAVVSGSFMCYIGQNQFGREMPASITTQKCEFGCVVS